MVEYLYLYIYVTSGVSTATVRSDCRIDDGSFPLIRRCDGTWYTKGNVHSSWIHMDSDDDERVFPPTL